MARVTWEANKVHTILDTVEQKAFPKSPLTVECQIGYTIQGEDINGHHIVILMLLL